MSAVICVDSQISITTTSNLQARRFSVLIQYRINISYFMIAYRQLILASLLIIVRREGTLSNLARLGISPTDVGNRYYVLSGCSALLRVDVVALDSRQAWYLNLEALCIMYRKMKSLSPGRKANCVLSEKLSCIYLSGSDVVLAREPNTLFYAYRNGYQQSTHRILVRTPGRTPCLGLLLVTERNSLAPRPL